MLYTNAIHIAVYAKLLSILLYWWQ